MRLNRAKIEQKEIYANHKLSELFRGNQKLIINWYKQKITMLINWMNGSSYMYTTKGIIYIRYSEMNDTKYKNL